MNKKSGSGSAIFMMEMIIVVFFFILCSATCILLFAKANSMSRLAKDTNRGVAVAESVVEVWKAEGREGVINRFEAAAGEAEGSWIICWDLNWKVAPQGGAAAYSGTFVWYTADGLESAAVRIVRLEDQTVLYDLAAKKYQGSSAQGKGMR